MDTRCQGPEWRGVFFDANPDAETIVDTSSPAPSPISGGSPARAGSRALDEEQQRRDLEEQQQELETLFGMMEQQQELQQLKHIQAEFGSAS
jgi:hypothetical protein